MQSGSRSLFGRLNQIFIGEKGSNIPCSDIKIMGSLGFICCQDLLDWLLFFLESLLFLVPFIAYFYLGLGVLDHAGNCDEKLLIGF